MMERGANEALIATMMTRGVLHTPRVAEAFRRVDRGAFVPEAAAEEAYGDYPLSIAEEQTISQPSTVAFMLELLGAEAGDRVLDIGSGSGWTTALLGYIVGPEGTVTGVERQKALVAVGRKNIAPFHFGHVRIEPAGDRLGRPGEAFDAILVSASAQQIPQQLFAQLKPGGRLVIPVRNSILRFTRVADAQLRQEEYPGFVFVPLIYAP